MATVLTFTMRLHYPSKAPTPFLPASKIAEIQGHLPGLYRYVSQRQKEEIYLREQQAGRSRPLLLYLLNYNTERVFLTISY